MQRGHTQLGGGRSRGMDRACAVGAGNGVTGGKKAPSRMLGWSRFTQPGNQRDSLDEETTNWRAVCEKTARTVRRAGSAQADPDPYHTHRSSERLRSMGPGSRFARPGRQRESVAKYR